MIAPCNRATWLQGGAGVCRTLPARLGAPRRIVLLGPPGIGKGTQAGLLSAALGACPLATSEIMHGLFPPSPLSRRLPTDTLLELINARSHCLACAAGFILDGFPRTVAHAEALDHLLQEKDLSLDAVILYELPVSLIVLRLLGRRVCPTCQKTYHVKARPPRITGRCDDCQTILGQQREDRLDAIRLMQGTHPSHSPRLLGYYQSRGLLVKISAHGTAEEIFMRTIDTFKMTRLGDRCAAP